MTSPSILVCLLEKCCGDDDTFAQCLGVVQVEIMWRSMLPIPTFPKLHAWAKIKKSSP